VCGWAFTVNCIILIDSWAFLVCGWAVTVNSIRLIDCLGFCCMWLSCYCEQYKVKTNFQGIVCGRWLDCCGTGQGQVVELLWMWQWMFRFHKMGGISWVAEELLASEREHCNYSNEVFVGRTVAQMQSRLWISVCCHGLNISQPQALHNSSLLTHNKCFPTPNCVAASQSAPVCIVWYPLLSK